MTHDFVHKTHTYIFGGHYPPMLMDWYTATLSPHTLDLKAPYTRP